MLFLALGLAVLLGLQAPVAPSASAGVTGRVLETDTKRPVPGAQVSLVPEARPQGGVFAPPRAERAETDANGVYRFENLEAGRYRLMVQRAGFAIQGFPPSPPPAVQVLPGQIQTAPDVLLERGGVIAGRVMDHAGQPLAEARVMAMRPSPRGRGNAPILLPVGSSAQTNDLGEFRLYSLPAGEYYVQMAPLPNPDFAGGGGTPPETAPAATFYPGTADPASAQAIAVAAGQTVQDIVFSAVVVPVFQVSGIVVDENGAPVADAMIMLMPDRSSGALPFGPPARARADREGRFRVANVPSGAYMANASVPVVLSSDAGRGSGAGVSAWSGVSSVSAGGGLGGSVMVESRNCTTVQYRNDNSIQVRVTVQDAHVADVRLVVRRQ